MQTNTVAQSGATGYYLGALDSERTDRAVDYDVSAAHGWEFLLDNLDDEAADQRPDSVHHAVVLGEN